MSRVSSHLTRRGGVFQYRRRVPAELADHPAFRGRPDFRKSLKTTNANTAREESLKLDRWIEGMLAEARGHQATPFAPAAPGLAVSTDYLRALQARWFEVSMEVDQQSREGALADERLADRQAQRDDADAFLWSQMRNGRDPMAAQIAYRAGEALDEVKERLQFEATKFNLREGEPDYKRLKDALVEAEYEALRGRIQRQGGAISVEPSVEAIRGAIGRPVVREASWTITQLAEDYIKAKAPGEDWAEKLRGKAKLFEEYLGRRRAITEITRKDIKGFAALLRRTPSRATLWFPGVPFVATADANERRPQPYPVLDAKTINETYLAVLRALLGYAYADLEVLQFNPAADIKIEGGKGRLRRRKQFDIDELNAFFRLPVFAGCRSPKLPNTPGDHRIDDHRFWVPLLMLFTGARPSELAQLAVTDVKLNRANPYIGILTEFDEDDPDDKPWVTAFKTANARREVPIHPTIIDLGFTAYVERARQNGERLFPLWKPAKTKRKRYSQARWIRNINELYIPEITQRVPKPTFYALKHTFKTRMAVEKIPPQFQNQILGHAHVGMDTSYLDTMPIDEVAEELKKLNYPGLELSHLTR